MHFAIFTSGLADVRVVTFEETQSGEPLVESLDDVEQLDIVLGPLVKVVSEHQIDLQAFNVDADELVARREDSELDANLLDTNEDGPVHFERDAQN